MDTSAINFPTLTAIINQGALNKEGLVADVLFPPLEVGACDGSMIDWDHSYELLKSDDTLSCYADVKEIDQGKLEKKLYQTKQHGNAVAVTECCLNACGIPELKGKVEESKVVSLFNRLLINRELRAVALATDETKYTANGTSGAPVKPSDATVNEGGLYYLNKTSLVDANFDLLDWFQPIQDNNYLTGKRNVAIMAQSTLNALVKNKAFIGYGCQTNPTTSAPAVAALLGLDQIIVADAGFNNAINKGTVSMANLWPKDYIMFLSKHDITYALDQQPTFGFSPYTINWATKYWTDIKKGAGDGVVFAKIGHDLNETVLTYKAATLVKLV